MKIAVSVVLIICGLIAWVMWESGTHGHVRFRPYMLEDWIISSVLLVCFGIPIIFLFMWLRRRGRKSV